MIEITDDVFDIVSRIKSINSDYKLYFDKTDSKFKVYLKGTMQLVLPFTSLDKRVVDYVAKTQIKNISILEKEIDESNEKLIKAKRLKLKEKRLESIDNALKIIKN